MYKENSYLIKIFIIILFVGIGLWIAKCFQPQSKTITTYSKALEDYENEDYSNAYYLFSKISITSNLKPLALYRQAQCAKALGDRTSELKNYRKLFNNYSNIKLSNEARYYAGQLILEDNPNLAYKYFKAVSKSDIDEDFKIASKYYMARIKATKIRYSTKKVSQKELQKIENSFRTYLEKYPDGRLATNVAETWKKFNPNLKNSDKILHAKAYLYVNDYKKVSEILEKIEDKDCWTLKAHNSIALNDIETAKKLIYNGIQKFSSNVNIEDYKKTLDYYIKRLEEQQKIEEISRLYSLANGTGKDYILNLKCENLNSFQKTTCYNELYKTYKNSEYSEKALQQIMMSQVAQKNYSSALNTAKLFIKKYPNSEFMPLVMFWAGKIEQKYKNSTQAIRYFQDIINLYPDSYYAYRAFWLLNNVHSELISSHIEYKPVVYPYKYPEKGNLFYNIIEVKDYEMLVKFANDAFVKSWAEYQHGNYATSLILARDGMAKINPKPVKNDLRWRLVYPQNYYKQIKANAERYNNNEILMLALIREESSFNAEAQSPVGAIGLMQLMPVTAHDIGNKYKIEFNTSNLFNPDLNIMLGNIYYSSLKKMLDEQDVTAISAYNGGVGSVSKWINSLDYNDTDEFIDQIPYGETKNYVIKVLRSYWNYLRIYQSH